MNRVDRFFAVASLLAVVFLIVVLNLTTPSDVGPLGVLVFFTLGYIVCLGVMVGLCRIFFALLAKMRRQRLEANRKRSYYYASVLAFVPIVLIFMRSFGELGVLEVFLALLLGIIGCFFVSKRA